MAESNGQRKGVIICPKCGFPHLRIYATQPLVNGMIRRYRKCRRCGYNMPPDLQKNKPIKRP